MRVKERQALGGITGNIHPLSSSAVHIAGFRMGQNDQTARTGNEPDSGETDIMQTP